MAASTTPPSGSIRMRAISQDSAGGPEVLKLVEMTRPAPTLTEVLVRVYAAGVNPTDWKTRARGRYATGIVALFVLGFDVSGVVEETGPGVTIFAPGDEVFGMPRFPHPAGAYAEFVAAPARHFVPKPATIDHVTAAALPLASLTAWQALVDTAGVQPGQRVLVHAAAGGVGHLAVQIAKARGAYVIGTASAGKHDVLRGLGADELVDYTAQDFSSTLRDVDIVIDAIGGDYTPRSLRTLRRGGILVSLLPSDPDFPHELARELEVRATRLLVEPDHAGLQAIAALVAQGQLRPLIHATVPLALAARAHEIGETNRTTGKIVLSVVDQPASRPAPAVRSTTGRNPANRRSAACMSTDTDADTDSTAKVVDSFFARFGAGDIPGLLDLFADPVDFAVNGAPNVPWSGARSSRAELAEFFASFGRELTPPEEFTITAKVIDGPDAVVLGRNRFEVLSTRKTFTNDFALHFTVRGGRITGYHMDEDSYAISTAFTGGSSSSLRG